MTMTLDGERVNGLAEADRDYWHKVLVAGGFSELPRWSTDPRAAVDDRSVMLPDHLLMALESRGRARRAGQLGAAGGPRPGAERADG